jgi:hypothetical protein
MRSKFDIYVFITIKQVWTQKCAVQKASVDVNISYYFCLKSGPVFLFQIFIIAPLPLPRDIRLYH